MCMIDDGDGYVTMLSQADPVARKAHQCKECWREIAPGERYRVERFVFEGAMSVHKVCTHCQVGREWLSAECGGWTYGGIAEDIREHTFNGHYEMGVHRLAVGMAWKWRTPSGRMLPVPTMPATSH